MVSTDHDKKQAKQTTLERKIDVLFNDGWYLLDNQKEHLVLKDAVKLNSLAAVLNFTVGATKLQIFLSMLNPGMISQWAVTMMECYPDSFVRHKGNGRKSKMTVSMKAMYEFLAIWALIHG